MPTTVQLLQLPTNELMGVWGNKPSELTRLACTLDSSSSMRMRQPKQRMDTGVELEAITPAMDITEPRHRKFILSIWRRWQIWNEVPPHTDPFRSSNKLLLISIF